MNTRATENAWEIESSMKTCKSYFYGKCFVDKQNDNEVTIQPYYGDRMRICKKMLVLKCVFEKIACFRMRICSMVYIKISERLRGEANV